jgi:hypothetical protein
VRRFGAIAVAFLTMALPASAETQDAATLFEAGLKQMEAHDYGAGCPALRESYRLEPRPGTLFTLAECEAKWGKAADALQHYRAFLDTVAQMSQSELPRQEARVRIAETQAAALERDVPQLTIDFSAPAPSGTRVTLDGNVVPPGVMLRLDVGSHTLVFQAPGKGATTTNVTLGTGERRRLELDPPGTAPKPSPPPPASEGALPSAPLDHHASPLPWIVGGVGVAGILVGGISGGLVLAKKAVVDEHCKGTACDAEGQRAVESGRTLGWVSTIALGIGVVGVATSIVLFATQSSSAFVKAARVLVVGTASASTFALDARF